MDRRDVRDAEHDLDRGEGQEATPGLVARRDGVVVTVAALDVADGWVTRIRVVRNPEKLGPWIRED